jgi:sugar phosphate isomerase/epimerase
MSAKTNRRKFFKVSAAAASAPFMLNTPGHASAPIAQASSLRIGIATLGFNSYSNAQLAAELAEQDLKIVQLFLSQTDSRYWRYNGRSDVSELTPSRCEQIAAVYRKAGIALHSLGVYTNLIHPDPAERQKNLAYFAAMMRVANQMGIKALITEAGHYHSEDAPEPRVPHHFQEEVWKTMVATAKQLGELADDHGVTVLVEPFFRGFLASAKRTRVFLEEVDSPRIRALLDPANLLEVNDLEEMFAQLSPWIDCLHAKDRKLHVDRGVPAGQGDLDYEQFVTLAAKHTPNAPLILEYVGPDDYRQAREHLAAAMAAAS